MFTLECHSLAKPDASLPPCLPSFLVQSWTLHFAPSHLWASSATPSENALFPCKNNITIHAFFNIPILPSNTENKKNVAWNNLFCHRLTTGFSMGFLQKAQDYAYTFHTPGVLGVFQQWHCLLNTGSNKGQTIQMRKFSLHSHTKYIIRPQCHL